MQRHLSQESAGRWLLIFDNVDDMDMWVHGLKDYLPRSQHRCVVLTTQNRKIAVKFAQQNVVEISEMDTEAAMQLLDRSLLNHDLLDCEQDARKLLEKLTFLPLAMVQAAAYINENRITLSDYLSLLDEQEQDVVDLLSEDFEDEGRYHDVKNPVATTWLISFYQIRRHHPLAAEYFVHHVLRGPKNDPAVAPAAGTVSGSGSRRSRHPTCVLVRK
jgi:murein DD-endopeptidase MepM/ murein hydrolase activator NlpD